MCLDRPQLKTRQGTELLIQSEVDSVIADWHRALTETISSHVRTFLNGSKKVQRAVFACSSSTSRIDRGGGLAAAAAPRPSPL